MSQPLFTIAIPTYNRPVFLRESLRSATLQTYPNLEILVCDNCSTDDTREVVKSFGDSRIRYVKNSSNIGAQANFALAVESGRGQYFSWLQDDDLIVSDFAERAVEVMQLHDAHTYLGTAIYSPTVQSLHEPQLYCPPIAMDWISGDVQRVSAATMLHLSLVASVAIPPVIAFERERLYRSGKSLRDSNFPLFTERSLLCETSACGHTVADPRLCGIFRQHTQQASAEWCAEKNRLDREWNLMATYLDTLADTADFDATEQVSHCLESIPQKTLRNWLTASQKWPTNLGLACSMRRALVEAGKLRGVEAKPRGIKAAIARIRKNF